MAAADVSAIFQANSLSESSKTSEEKYLNRNEIHVVLMRMTTLMMVVITSLSDDYSCLEFVNVIQICRSYCIY